MFACSYLLMWLIHVANISNIDAIVNTRMMTNQSNRVTPYHIDYTLLDMYDGL